MLMTYHNYIEERRREMRGKTDACYMNMRFESFIELSKKIRSAKKHTGTYLRYNGTDLCGDIEIGFGYVDETYKMEVLKLAGETLKPFM